VMGVTLFVSNQACLRAAWVASQPGIVASTRPLSRITDVNMLALARATLLNVTIPDVGDLILTVAKLVRCRL